MIISAAISYDPSTRRFTLISPEGSLLSTESPADIYGALFAHMFRRNGPFATLTLAGEVHVVNTFDNRANVTISINEARQWGERYGTKEPVRANPVQ